MRTMQTGNLMNEYHSLKIIKDNRLVEVNQGIFTGRKKSDLTEKENLLRKNADKQCGLENYQSVFSRTKNFYDEIIKQCNFDNILIITHNVNASMLDCLLNGIEVDINNRNHTHRFDNAEIKHYVI